MMKYKSEGKDDMTIWNELVQVDLIKAAKYFIEAFVTQ